MERVTMRSLRVFPRSDVLAAAVAAVHGLAHQDAGLPPIGVLESAAAAVVDHADQHGHCSLSEAASLPALARHGEER